MSPSIKTVFVTDVPFWERSTGAQLRIAQLVENFSAPPFQTSVLLTQSPSAVIPSAPDSLAPTIQLDPSQPPRSGFWSKTKWQMRATAHWLGLKPRPHSPTFENYYPAAWVEHFKDFVQTEKPDVIIFEYATQVQLLRALPNSVRQKIISAVDTHDILWQRARQFEEQGQQHWISVSQSQEESALAEFDLVIAIQPEEATYFKELLGDQRVIVTGMEFPAMDADTDRLKRSNRKRESDEGPDKIVIGYLASNNWANLDAASQILEFWAELERIHSHIELVIAGSLCEAGSIRDSVLRLERANLLGSVDSPDEFYDRVDIVWNPVRFGTGLKIKNLEAMLYAKCLVTSPHGAIGIWGSQNNPENGQSPIVILDTAAQMSSFLSGKDSSLIEELGQLGRKHLDSAFGPGTQYPRLRHKIESLYSEKHE